MRGEREERRGMWVDYKNWVIHALEYARLCGPMPCINVGTSYLAGTKHRTLAKQKRLPKLLRTIPEERN